MAARGVLLQGHARQLLSQTRAACYTWMPSMASLFSTAAADAAGEFSTAAADAAGEQMQYDVCIVGAGPAGLSAAIKFKQARHAIQRQCGWPHSRWPHAFADVQREGQRAVGVRDRQGLRSGCGPSHLQHCLGHTDVQLHHYDGRCPTGWLHAASSSGTKTCQCTRHVNWCLTSTRDIPSSTCT
jgi:hypothetical protein